MGITPIRRALLRAAAGATIGVPLSGCSGGDRSDAPRLVVDSDMGPDCDDAGAVALAHVYADRGEADLLGLTCSTGGHSGKWGPLCFDAINTYYGRPDLPIGVRKGPGNDDPAVNASEYAEPIARSDRYPTSLDPDGTLPGAVDTYRRLLSEQPSNAVTIVSIGYLSNLRNLLDSGADERSSMTGRELVADRVEELVVMGGEYPSSGASPEWNFAADPAATARVVEEWPTDITYTGFEVGVNIETGGTLVETPERNPVREAYRLFHDGTVAPRPSWDLTAVHYAVEGLADDWQRSVEGRATFTPSTGYNGWTTDTSRTDTHLRLATGPSKLEAYYDELLTEPPASEET
jgi:inosine-uridine nucleoside N-ribohydrolase